MQGQPMIIMGEDSQRVKDKDAQEYNISAARAVAEAVRSTLGPKGMDKMLVDSMGDVTITNDGVTILQEMDIDNPTAEMIVEVAETQEDEAGDGTTTAVAIAGELLKNAEDLLEQEIHPTAIIKGFNMASEQARIFTDEIAENVDSSDEALLRKVAETSMTGKGAELNKELLAELIVNAVSQVTVEADDGENVVDLDNIKVETQTGRGVGESELLKGAVIDKDPVHDDMPTSFESADVFLTNVPIEVSEADADTQVSIDSPDQLQKFLDQEEKELKEKVDRIVETGADVVFCQKGIDDAVRYLLAKDGLLTVERTRQDELHTLARATGATPVAKTDELTPAETGTAGLVTRRTVGPTELTVVSDCAGIEQVSLLLRGETEQIVDETKRVIDGCLYALKHAVEGGRVVPGGGAVEMCLARSLEARADGISGREQFAVRAFAESLTTVPETLATSAGLSPVDSVVELRTRGHEGATRAGIVSGVGVVDDTLAHGVVDPFEVKQRALRSAVEAANVLLRVDDVIAAAGEGGDADDGHDHDHGPGDVVEASGGYPWTLGH